MADEPIVAAELTVDSEWMVKQIVDINKKLGVLPAIEDHLDKQNASIEKTVAACSRNNRIALRNARRVKLLEDAAKEAIEKRAANWGRVIGSSLKIVEGLVLTFLLLKVLGWA